MDRQYHSETAPKRTPGPYDRKPNENSASGAVSHSNRALLEHGQTLYQEENHFNSLAAPFQPIVHDYYGENINPQTSLLQPNQFEQHHISDMQQKLFPLNPLNNPGVPDFVKKLFRLLENTSYDSIVSWGIRRVTFAVKDPEEFARHILAKHFKHNNFASFVRQLNKYDFHKVKMSADDAKIYGERAWEFQHPDFQADRPELLEKIKRKAPSGRSKAVPAGNTVGSPSLSSSSNEPSHEDLHQLKGDLQSQIDTLAGIQGNMAAYLQSLSKNCTMVVEELAKFRKNMVAQDTLMQNLVEYMMQQESAGTEQKITNTSQFQTGSSQNIFEGQTSEKGFPPTPSAPLHTPPLAIEDVAMPFAQHPQAERLITNETFDNTNKIPRRAFAAQASPDHMTYNFQSLYGPNFMDAFQSTSFPGSTSYGATSAF